MAQVVKVNVNVSGWVNRMQNNDALWTAVATEWWRLYSPFVPFQTGALMETVKISPKQIEHTVPYANDHYHGNFNFRKDKHPLATKEWDKHAIASKQASLIKFTQDYINVKGF